MKPTILKVFSNYPDISYNLKKNEENHLIRISNVENQNSGKIKCEFITNTFCDNQFSNDDNVNESNRDFNVLEDYYRFQERRNAFMDSKKSITQNNQSQQKRIFERPNFSYTQLIYMAIESSALKALTVNDIYNWCEVNFQYYANAIHGWKNSLRHNLSINKCFKKITKMGQGGRGSLWIVDPREKQHLVSTMKRTNVTSYSTPSFIIQTASKPTEQSKITVIDDQVFEIPQDDTIVISEDLQNSQLSSDITLLLEEKPSYSWTDTRLPSEFSIALSPDDCSHASDTDYNDWRRAMITLEPIFPVKQHQFKSKGTLYPVVTPPTSIEHNYSISDLQTVIDDPCSIVRHIFQPSVDSNISYCTSSDYNDEEWPRTPSPISINTLQPFPIKTKIVKSGIKRGRPPKQKHSESLLKSTKKDQLILSKTIKKDSIFSNSLKRVAKNERIDNMYNLNNFIHSL